MKCKYCGQQLPEGSTFCPACGWKEEPQPETSPEETGFGETIEIVPPETQPQGTMEEAEEVLAPEVRKMKRTAAISGCIAVLAVLAAVLFFGIRGTFSADGKGWDLGSITLFRENDIYKKDSYTVDTGKANKKADVVVATLGGAKLTNSQLQIYYQMEIDTWIRELGYYSNYFGLDYTKPLDQQQCLLPTKQGYTWQQVFLESALVTWKQSQALALEAEKNQFQLDEQTRAYLQTLESTMQELAAKNGYDGADAMIRDQFGGNTTVADWESYMEVTLKGYQYYAQLCQSIETPSNEELAAYFQANKETLEAQGIKQDGSYLVDVRHILIEVEGGVESADGAVAFPDAALAAKAKYKAQQILNQWLEDPTEDNFAALAKEHTADGNGDAGGLYTGVEQGRMVKTFNDWCFDASRQKGDYGIVETRFGYHIMFFSGRGEEVWLPQTRQAYLSQQQTAILEETVEGYDIEVSYGKIALAAVDLG